MRPIDIEFLPSAEKPVWLGYLLTGLLAFGAVFGGWEVWDLAMKNQKLDLDISNLHTELTKYSEVTAERRRQVKFPVTIADAKRDKLASFPLGEILTTLENARIEGVRVGTLDIHAKDGIVKLEIEASDVDLFFKYLDALNINQRQEKWRLVRLQAPPLPALGVVASIASEWPTPTIGAGRS